MCFVAAPLTYCMALLVEIENSECAKCDSYKRMHASTALRVGM